MFSAVLFKMTAIYFSCWPRSRDTDGLVTLSLGSFYSAKGLNALGKQFTATEGSWTYGYCDKLQPKKKGATTEALRIRTVKVVLASSCLLSLSWFFCLCKNRLKIYKNNRKLNRIFWKKHCNCDYFPLLFSHINQSINSNHSVRILVIPKYRQRYRPSQSQYRPHPPR